MTLVSLISFLLRHDDSVSIVKSHRDHFVTSAKGSPAGIEYPWARRKIGDDDDGDMSYEPVLKKGSC